VRSAHPRSPTAVSNQNLNNGCKIVFCRESVVDRKDLDKTSFRAATGGLLTDLPRKVAAGQI
jgi:hypothetical protein